ncbi:MAG: PilZ domain-containing protein [Croceibacterium sp.]
MVNRDDAYQGPERRATGRFETSLAVQLRATGQTALPATVTTLSHLGCTVTGVTLRSSETSAWIRLPGLESQLARRCWATPGEAGFAFERPLYPAVADRFNGERPIVQRPNLTLVHDADPLPASRRDQILQGRAEIPAGLTMARRPSHGKATLGGLVRRHAARVVDQRHEPRFPPPADATLGFHAAGEPAGIHDLSPSGVRVEAELRGGIGGPVKVSFAGFTPMDGTIVWVRDGATGVRLSDNALDLSEA